MVYCPYLWHPGWIDDKDPPVFHDSDEGDRRTIDVSRDPWSRTQHRVEARGEELRLAYVALTRAKYQAVAWWAATWDSRDSSLCRLLFFRDEHGDVAWQGDAPPEDDEAVDRFEAFNETAPGCVSVERVDGGDGTRWTGEARTAGELSVSTFDRSLDDLWRRTSFSALTYDAHEARVASEDEEPVVTDEVAPPLLPAPADDELRSVPLPLAAMPAGADVGTFVHGVLERCDFASHDLDAALSEAFTAQSARWAVDVGDAAVFVRGLRAALETPLGPLLGDVRLGDIGRADRVDELSFELPLVGGDTPLGTLELASLAAVLEEHLTAGDPMRTYAARLREPVLRHEVRGYLTGSLDLVLRTNEGRYAVVDYKTNWLAPRDEPLTAWHYRPDALVEAMHRSHYPLQALLYTVALHRYLRWRVPDYTPQRHLAGVLYLFIRGMIGPDTPVVDGRPCGVFAWRPPESLVEAMSALFDTGLVPA